MGKRRTKNFKQMELPMMMVIPSNKEENKQPSLSEEKNLLIRGDASASNAARKGDEMIYKSIASRYFKIN
ncbi:hypothetical protein [uncultured Pseudacidovorax sp.]|uniref:hypothetical protein n=1 Tax=uncultured Pseudacidovorax sp. TaxID=679313 RepID=UPI0025D1919B|nr:hypothetical protein [uncultured Pseudacidovorax sp.]